MTTPLRLLDSIETDGALRAALLERQTLALEHLGEGTLLLLSLPAARALATVLGTLPDDGLQALPDGLVLVARGPTLALVQGGSTLAFLRREAADLAAAIFEMDSLASDLAAS